MRVRNVRLMAGYYITMSNQRSEFARFVRLGPLKAAAC